VGIALRLVPGSRPGELQSDTAASLDEARVDLEAAWQLLLA
jgi:hypothetical protein